MYVLLIIYLYYLLIWGDLGGLWVLNIYYLLGIVVGIFFKEKELIFVECLLDIKN